MPIEIYRSDDKYLVSVSPPDGRSWRSVDPMTVKQIFDRLVELGCHTTDISDALYAADPFWVNREHDEPR